jgi:hypothetical protein
MTWGNRSNWFGGFSADADKWGVFKELNQLQAVLSNVEIDGRPLLGEGKPRFGPWREEGRRVAAAREGPPQGVNADSAP